MEALGLDAHGIAYVASSLRDRATMVVNAYDTLGLLRWSDSCDGGTTAIKANSDGRIAVTGGRRSAWLAALFAPRLSISEGAGRKPEPVLSVVAQPNVFTRSTLVRVRVSPQRAFSVVVYDGCGRQVKRLSDGLRGSLDIAWDGCNDAGCLVSEGVYFVRVVEHESGAGKQRSEASAVVKITKL
jgi:hypothetical protein